MKISQRTKKLAKATMLLGIGTTVSAIADYRQEIRIQDNVICDMVELVNYLDAACVQYENIISAQHE